MRRPFALLIGGTLAAAACNPPAPGGTAASPQDPTIVTYTGMPVGQTFTGAAAPSGQHAMPGPAERATGAMMGDAPRSVGTTVPQPPSAVWETVKRAYLALKIPVTVENPLTHQIGNAKFYATHRLADSLMSTWLDCGNGPTGLRANDDRIYMTLLTSITPNAAGGTNLETVFVAQSLDVAGGSSDVQQCASKGRFEQLLHETVRANAPR